MRLDLQSGGGVEIVIAYSEDKTTLKFLFSVAGETEQKHERFSVLDLRIDDLLGRGFASASSIIGTLALNLLEQLVEGGIGFTTDDSSVKMKELTKSMYERAASGDPDALAFIGGNFLSQSVSTCDESLLELADGWLRKAADMGHEASRRFYDETWPKVKATSLEEIRKRQARNKPE